MHEQNGRRKTAKNVVLERARLFERDSKVDTEDATAMKTRIAGRQIDGNDESEVGTEVTPANEIQRDIIHRNIIDDANTMTTRIPDTILALRVERILLATLPPNLADALDPRVPNNTSKAS